MSHLLAMVLDKFTQLGEDSEINNLSELASYDIVINCTGLGIWELVNDKKNVPSERSYFLSESTLAQTVARI